MLKMRNIRGYKRAFMAIAFLLAFLSVTPTAQALDTQVAYQQPQYFVDKYGLDVAVGEWGTCAFSSGGFVECIYYQKISAWNIQSTRQVVPNLKDVIKISIGANYACAIKRNLTLVCWGKNSPEPAEVPGLQGVTDVLLILENYCVIANGFFACDQISEASNRPTPGIPLGEVADPATDVDAMFQAFGGEPIPWGGGTAYYGIPNPEVCYIRFKLDTTCFKISSYQKVVLSYGWETIQAPCLVQATGRVDCWFGQFLYPYNSYRNFEFRPLQVYKDYDVKFVSLDRCALTRSGEAVCLRQENGVLKYYGVGKSENLVKITQSDFLGFNYGVSKFGELVRFKRGDGNPQVTDFDLGLAHAHKVQTTFTSARLSWISNLNENGVVAEKFKVRITSQSSVEVDIQHETLHKEILITGLKPSTTYRAEVSSLIDGISQPSYVFDFETQDPSRDLTLIPNSSTANSVGIVLAGGNSAALEEIESTVGLYRLAGESEWIQTQFLDSNAFEYTIRELLPGTNYEFKFGVQIDGSTFSTEPVRVATLGVRNWTLKLTDSSGLPVVGDFSWVSVDGRFGSSGSKKASVLGEVTFSSVPAKQVKLIFNNAKLANGDLISYGELQTWSNGSSVIRLPELGASETRRVSVRLPNGDPIDGARIETTGVNPEKKFQTEGFLGWIRAPEQQLPILTSSDGSAAIRGFYQDSAKVFGVYDDGELSQATESLAFNDQVVLDFSYMPTITVVSEQLTSNANQIVSIPVTIQDSSLVAGLTAQETGRVGVASYSGKRVTIVPPSGASQKACKTKPVLSATTNSEGKATLKVCASLSGDYRLRGVGAVATGAIKILVRNSKPTVVMNLGASSRANNQALLAWSSPEFDGGSPVTAYQVRATDGVVTKTILVRQGSGEFNTGSLNLNSLSGGRMWTVQVQAINRRGAGPASTVRFSVAGLALFANQPTPTISGKLTVGKTISVKTGKWDKEAKLSFQWMRDGVEIAGANSSRYLVTSFDKGKRLSVKVSAVADGFIAAEKTSASGLVR